MNRPNPSFFRGAGIALSASLLLLLSAANAEVRLPNVIGGHLVLQRDKPIKLWGWADAGEAVTVALGDATAKAGDDGKWSAQLPAQKANAEPQTLGINEIKLTDILIGEVWIYSGQSNMAWAMKSTAHAAEEIPKADHPAIRLYKIGKGVHERGQVTGKGSGESRERGQVSNHESMPKPGRGMEA